MAVEGATQKKIRKKKSQFCPPPGLTVLTIIGITKKMKRRKNARIKKNKKAACSYLYVPDSPHKNLQKTKPLGSGYKTRGEKRKTFKKRCIIKATKFEIKTNTNDVTK